MTTKIFFMLFNKRSQCVKVKKKIMLQNIVGHNRRWECEDEEEFLIETPKDLLDKYEENQAEGRGGHPHPLV